MTTHCLSGRDRCRPSDSKQTHCHTLAQSNALCPPLPQVSALRSLAAVLTMGLVGALMLGACARQMAPPATAEPAATATSTPAVTVAIPMAELTPATERLEFGAPRDLVALAASVSSYRVSSDGRWISYMASPGQLDVPGFEQGGLVAQSFNGQVVPLVAGLAVQDHIWLPNSHQLVVVLWPTEGRPGDVVVVSLGSEPARSLLKPTVGSFMPLEAAVSLDGSMIAIAIAHDASPAPVPQIEVVVAELDGECLRRLVEPDFFIIHSLAWSPDGSEVVYFRGKGGTPPDDGEAYAVGAKTPGEQPRLLLSRAKLIGWSANGREALWQSEPADDEGAVDLLVSNWPEVGTARRLVEGADASGASWVGEGTVAYTRKGGLYLVSSLTEAKAERLTSATGWAVAPEWLPGQGVVYRAGELGGSVSKLRLLPLKHSY